MRLFRFLALLAPLPVLHVACVGDDPVASPSPQGDGGASSSSSSSSGGSSSGSSGDAGVGETAITGTVVDQVGNPVAGAEVRLESNGKIATTGVDGKFAFDAPATYALTVVHPSESTASKKAMMAVVGLTTRQPRVQVVAGALRQSTSNTYRLQGIAPGVFPIPNDARVSFVFEPDMVALPVTRTLGAGSAATEVLSAGAAVSWYGNDPFKGQLHALRYTIDTDPTLLLPINILGYGSTGFSISQGGTSDHTLNMTTVTNKHITGNIVRNGLTASTLTYIIRVGGTAGVRFSSRSYPSTTFDLPVPSTATFSAAIEATATGPSGGTSGQWRGNLKGDVAGLTLAMPPELVAKAPAEDATGIDVAAEYSWQPMPELKTFALEVSCGSQPDVRFVVLTDKLTAKIPDAAALGAGIPSGRPCRWAVTAVTAANTDELVGPLGWQRFTGVEESLADNGRFAKTKQRAFTSK